MEVAQYCGEWKLQLCVCVCVGGGGGGGGFSTVHQYIRGIISVLWRVSFSTVGDNISTVEVIQYSGDKDLKYYERNFSRAHFASQSDRPHRRPQVLTMADTVKDLGYKNLVLGKIPLLTYDRPDFWKYSVKFFGNCGRICEQFMSSAPRELQQLLRMNSNSVGIQSKQWERLENEGTTLK